MKTGASLKNRQGGAVAVMVGISIVLLVGFLALVIDLGRLYVAKTGLQNAADAAALSGAKQLDGTGAHICCGSDSAAYMAINTAGRNTFFGSAGQENVVISEGEVWVSTVPNPETDGDSATVWVLANDAKDEASNSYFFIKVDTASGNLTTWFAPVFDLITGGSHSNTSTFGMAVAGRYPPGALVPIILPVVRRNDDQVNFVGTDADPSFPHCSGAIYDSSDNKLKDTCPQNYNANEPDTSKHVTYRGVDTTTSGGIKNWGFLTPGQTKTYPDKYALFPSSSDNVRTETGTYYEIKPQPNNDFTKMTPWGVTPTAPWTGNFGLLLAGDQQLKLIEAALCRGGGMFSYSVPGCADVKPGGSNAQIVPNLNTRFEEYSNQVALSPQLCPPDTNIKDWGPPPVTYPPAGYPKGFYLDGYVKGNPVVPPVTYAGKADRRLIRVYVADNAWLPGYNAATNDDDACYASKLTGGSEQAHLVGCADFFMWTRANKKGGDKYIYAEFVRAVPLAECRNSPSTFTEIRLFR